MFLAEEVTTATGGLSMAAQGSVFSATTMCQINASFEIYQFTAVI